MPINISLPKPGRYKKGTKDLIVSALTYAHPLSLKQLLDKTKREYGVSVSYAAIRKSAQELVLEKVLRKKGRVYELNPDWIMEVRAFVDSMQANYLERYKPLERIDVGENVTVYTVSSIYEAERLWGDLLLDWTANLKSGSNHASTFQTSHLWILLFHLVWEEKQIVTMREKSVGMRALLYSGTFLDKIAAKFYDDTGVPTKVLNDRSFIRGCELGTYDDMIIQLYHPPEIADEIDKFYSSVRRLEDVNLARLSEIAKRRVPIKLSVFKNAEMANQIRNSIARHFPQNQRQ